jgi:hypothetical protein
VNVKFRAERSVTRRPRPGRPRAALRLAAAATAAVASASPALAQYNEADALRVTAPIFKTLREATQQLSATLDRQVYADERMRNAEQQNDAIQARQEIRAETESGEYDPGATACLALSGAEALSAGAGAGGAGPAANGHDMQNRSRSWARGAGPGGEDVRYGISAVARGIIEDRDRLSGLDGHLDPTSDIRMLTADPTVDTTDPDRFDALWRLRQNILDPAPPRPVTSSQAGTPEGLVETARRQVDDARRSTASDLFTFVESLRAPVNAELGEWARRNAPPGYAHPIPQSVSLQQWLDIEIASRFMNPAWQTRVAKMSPEAVERELRRVEAVRTQIRWLGLRLGLRGGLAGAARLASSMDGGERQISR